ncbi:MAG: hypothetical protein A3A96_02035 [Candidatus Zambryskibacteria bacterium RIFCSPLOWO2_01_FULL_39_39]|uniref:Uncharacterized protein n=1 Tax=Candidatus Zambryskibacteria bacterium RIFCSPLOWO2_01_FULL_39_39 TaxID=1802758 RepID=A0A1G2TWF6_9BACT|nr:MAG: hypothetical protein A2644_01075 [Candidatus Zambryskibacteria bacterium RIFCSPHIGHO2_01_FULL_39_63]OHA94546.1 MAG: hypothetical protein A3B88_01535 [Candidatus Zambryskibacteria bacterium RIFCSPHIGHO2_02_FULL_39_19]OHA98380.1 MAG: hypothetical protein A3F20_01735 [Candidatus Zambryskibacteria bacterium RIFCSPHIGHO2_12_FULL_39_21]OHB01503.1 MAG: hypothetical protein A3A96_02035 [Candidatus Zambryskibacteria bacterium RIFCSPLOWO2_01_FULL_39_39]
MIYTPRSSDTNHTCTKINFRGFEISIAMDDCGLRGNKPLTRSSIAVFNKNEANVTDIIARETNLKLDHGEILNCDAEDLYKVMQAIVNLPVSAGVRGVLEDRQVGT